MAVPESMTVLDISGQYTMVRGLTLAPFGHYYLRSRYLWRIKGGYEVKDLDLSNRRLLLH